MRTLLWVFRDAAAIGIGKRIGASILLLQLLASLFEILGVTVLVPVFQYLNSKGDVATLAAGQKHWAYLAGASQRTGVPLTLGSLILVCFALLIIRQGLTLARTLFEHRTRERSTARLRGRMFSQYLHATATYQDGETSGRMVSDIGFNANRSVLHIFSRLNLITLITIAAVYGVAMLAISPGMMVLLVAVMGITIAVVSPQILKARRLGRELVTADRSVSDFIVERLRMARLVRLSRTEPLEAQSINDLTMKQQEASLKVWSLLATVDSLIELIAVSMALGVIYVATGYLGVPLEIVALFLVMLIRLLPVVRQIAHSKQGIDATMASYEAVVRRLRETQTNREVATGTRPFAAPRTAITLEDVHYAYTTRTDTPALNGITASITANRMTALVGPSGAGKSTLVDLLPRIRVPTAGRVTIDGVDLTEFALGSLREVIAYLSQAPVIFNVPLIEHIRYGSPAATLEDVRAAARIAGADDFIMALPEQYQTRAGEGGKTLSGGQRQRLDLARALLSKAPILILDEPTASLDAQSELAFGQALDRIRKIGDRTIIVIAHRLATIETADHIIVVKDGRVSSAGTHASLTRADPWYRSAYIASTAQPAA